MLSDFVDVFMNLLVMVYLFFDKLFDLYVDVFGEGLGVIFY